MIKFEEINIEQLISDMDDNGDTPSGGICGAVCKPGSICGIKCPGTGSWCGFGCKK